ncbi:hypothetical protein BDB01DRAFT_34833 [Pilobolus umbonatus]|nr:hypothetical protein BDB01DRAFT_34833 [Pilobolus umbonatus]
MPRVQNEVHRHQMIYLALISKVLLYEEWSADSILIYIDMVRDFRDLRGFMKMNDSIADANKLDPTSITSVKYYIKETPFEGLDIDSFCMTLLTPLELWSRKVDTKSMEYALNQLIRKSCGSPNDGLFISAWQRLSFVYMDHHELIWCTLGECVHIMISQLKITENDLHDMTRLKHIIFVRLIPMLILQTIPKEYFKEVQVPRQYIALLKSRLVGLEVDPGLIRTSDKSKHSEVCIRLMDELINRCMNPYESHDIAKFAKSLLTKIFYRQ